MDVYMGTTPMGWQAHKFIKTITFNVTDDCNLACTYCYFVNKSSHSKMTIEIAKKAVDYILTCKEFEVYDGVVWDFIGGEPTIEIELIGQICDYILEKMFDISHKWFYCYKFMMCSNGLLYSSAGVQKLIRKYGSNLQISISIDGTKEKHDMSRVHKDGTGSYEQVVAQIPLWMKQQNIANTKATFAHDDLPMLKDSIIHLWNLGIDTVMANIVFENCWEPEDPIIFKNQLIELADYVLENKLWDKYSVRFFDPNIGHYLPENVKRNNYCGSGIMLAISTTGKFYPCVRFLNSSMENNKEGLCIGDIENGIDSDKLRSFLALDTISQSNEKCLSCEVASGCAWCSGFNYCDSDIDTIYERKTYNCEMHKANVYAAEYFWKKFEEKTNSTSPMRKIRIENDSIYQKYLYVLLDSTSSYFCQYVADSIDINKDMPDEIIKKCINFCDENHMLPIFIGKKAEKYSSYGYYIDTNFLIKADDYNCKVQYNEKCKNLILKRNRSHIPFLSFEVIKIFNQFNNSININVIFEDIGSFQETDFLEYKKQLKEISKYVKSKWEKSEFVNINLLTHILEENHDSACLAGINKFAVGLDGRFYLCPAFYFDHSLRNKFCIGDLDSGINNKYKMICDYNKCSGCRDCGAKQCNKCIYLNLTHTGELCVPPEAECIKSNIEREISIEFMDSIHGIPALKNKILNVDIDRRKYYDPLTEKKNYAMKKYFK